MKVRRSVILLIALVLALSAAAPVANAGQKQRLAAAVRAYSKAFLGGQAKRAWLMRTEHANAGLSYVEFRAVCLQARAIYGDAKMTSLKIVSMRGTRARVTYTYDVSDINQARQPWRLVGRHWRYDFSSTASSVPVRARGARGTTYVYVTDTGTKYHRKTCRTLSHSKYRKTLSWARSHGYKPCKICKPPTK